MAVLEHAERHRDLNGRRWIKLFRGVYMVKDALCPYVEEVLEEFHQKVLTSTFGSYRCIHLKPLLKEGTDQWSLTGSYRCSHCCADWINIIAYQHVKHPHLDPYMFKFCDLNHLNKYSWEIAKAFLPDVPQAQGAKHTEQAAQLDPYLLMKMIKDCNLFKPCIHVAVENVLSTRNMLAHSTKLGISQESEMEERMDKMIDLVELLPIPHQSILDDLKKARNGQIELDPEPSQKEMEIVQMLRREEDTLQRLREQLAETYLQHYINLQPVPWSAEVSLPINLVYQEQTLTGKAGASKQHGCSLELKSILELSGEKQLKPGTILIESPPGTGKSTLCQQLIQAWAERVKTSDSQPAARESTYQQAASQDDLKDSRLHKYRLVLFIRVRELSDGDLTENLKSNLVHSSWKENDSLMKCISENIEQVLLIVDGYDEGNDAQKRCVDGWLKGTDCRGCTLIVTSRPGFCRPTAQPEHNPNRTYTLTGLDRAKQQDFARKFDQAMGVGPGKRSASEQLQQFQDRDFLQTPLLLAFVCVLAIQGEDALPKTVSGLFNEFTEFLSLKAISGPMQFSNDYVAELLKFLQEIAFKLFKLKRSEITADELITHVSESKIEKTMDDLCKLGLVQQEITLKGWKNSQTGELIHQSFLDYFAACYFVSMCKEERSTLLEETEVQEYMLALAAGLCGDREEQHRECFWQMLKAWDRAMKEIGDYYEEDWDHSVRHACVLWLSELRDPYWLHADHISAIYRTCDEASFGAGIWLSAVCTESCYRGVTALLDAAHHHTLHDPRHAPCDPATFKLHVSWLHTDISPAAQLDLLDAARRYNVQLRCEALGLPDCLTRAQCDQLRAVLTRLNHLEELDIIVPSWTAANIVLQGLDSTSPLGELYVTCSPSSPRDSPPAAAAADAAEDSWSPRELIDTISRFSALEEIGLTDAESTLSTEHRIDITQRLSDGRPRVRVYIYDWDSETGEKTRWEMDSESDVDQSDSDTHLLSDSKSDE